MVMVLLHPGHCGGEMMLVLMMVLMSMIEMMVVVVTVMVDVLVIWHGKQLI